MLKATNPKDAIGAGKASLELVPDTLVVESSIAYLEGALKYGQFNWRVAGVRSSIYRAAMQRHLFRWWNGEDADPETGVKHLASVAACVGILLDAELCDKLNDDRPPRVNIGKLLDDAIRHAPKLHAMFKDKNPEQWTALKLEHRQTRKNRR